LSILEKIKDLFKFNTYAREILNSRKNIIIVVKNNEAKEVNQAFLDFFGVKSLKEFKKHHKCICELFKKEEGFLFGKDWIKELLKNPDKQYKVKIIKDNKEYIFKVEATKIKNKVIITLTDITELLEKQDELKEVSEILEQYKKAVDELLIVSKTDTNGIITYVNKNFCDISGYSKDELIGKPYDIVRHPDMPKEVFKDMWESIKSGKIWRGIIKNRKKDGGEYWVDTGIMPIKNSKGEIIEYIALENDITEIIKAKEKAQMAERAKGMFLATVSHEIRTPLNAILGFTQLLDKKENLDEESKKYISIINSSANTLLKIINDILDLSKIESEGISIEIKEFDPNKVFFDLASLFLAKAKEKNINYKIEIDKLPNCIRSDEHRIKQVLANLIGNAIKFTKEGGEVIVSIKVLQEDEKKVKIRFSVKDSGIGIPKDKQKEIFKAFTQADGSIAREFGGTGLGLTISSKIVEKLGGKIELISEVGKGSEFYFVLEFEKCNQVKTTHKEKSKKYNAKVLIAEDDKFNQELIKAVLKEWGIYCDIASDGEEAVRKVKENNYDLIFLDINMPKMSGIEALKEIKKITSTPVVALTANAFRDDIKRYFKAGFDDYLSKPIRLEELRKIFDKYVKNDFLSSLSKALNLNKDAVINLVNIYFENVKKDLKELKEAIKKKNFEEIRKYAHKIKGSSLNLGIDEVAEIANYIEENAKNKKEIDYENYFEKLTNFINNLEKEVKRESNFI